MPEVHVEYIKRRYLSNWLSIPTLIACIIWVGALILPLYISWETRLWMKEVLRFEQPNVEYKNQLIVHLYGLKGAADAYREPFVASWTTSSHANDLLAMEGTLRSVIVRSSSRDLNYDGLTDRLRIEVTMPLDVDETITGYYLAAYANYNLYVSLCMKSNVNPSLFPRPISAAWTNSRSSSSCISSIGFRDIS